MSRTMTYLTMPLLSLYILLTAGVGTHVCRCCGSVELVLPWFIAMIGDDASCGGQECASCCSTEVYAIEEAFCPRTDDCLADGMHPVADAVPLSCFSGLPVAESVFSGVAVSGGAHVLPPRLILSRISQYRL